MPEKYDNSGDAESIDFSDTLVNNHLGEMRSAG